MENGELNFNTHGFKTSRTTENETKSYSSMWGYSLCKENMIQWIHDLCTSLTIRKTPCLSGCRPIV